MKFINKKSDQVSLRSLVYVLIFSTIIFPFSCRDVTVEQQNQNRSIEKDDINNLLRSLDFDLSKVEHHPDYIIYDHDLAILKKDLIDRLNACTSSPNAKTDQAVINTDGIVNWSKVGNMTFKIDPSVSSLAGNWPNAIRQACSEWANVGQDNISFTETTSSADITFYADNFSAPSCLRDLESGVIARSMYPSNGNPGAGISVNSSQTFTYAQQVYAIKHELGHALGFRHTDWNDRGEPVDGNSSCGPVYGANRLKRTPDADANSVFNALLTSPTNFSTDDIRSIRMLYPDALSYPGIASAQRTNPRSLTYSISLNNLDDKTVKLDIWTEVYNTAAGGFYTLEYVNRFSVLDNSTVFFSIPNSGSNRKIKYRATNYKGDCVSAISPNFYQLP